MSKFHASCVRFRKGKQQGWLDDRQGFKRLRSCLVQYGQKLTMPDAQWLRINSLGQQDCVKVEYCHLSFRSESSRTRATCMIGQEGRSCQPKGGCSTANPLRLAYLNLKIGCSRLVGAPTLTDEVDAMTNVASDRP